MPKFFRYFLRRRVLIPAAAAAVLAAGAGAALASGSGAFPTPSGAQVVTVTSTTATVQWQSVGAGHDYDVLAFTQGGTQVFAQTTSATDLNITGLTPGTGYEWQVNTAGEAGVGQGSPYTPLMLFVTAAAAGPAGPQGPAGPAGATGATGPAGAQGPSGVSTVAAYDLGGLASANSGGSFSTGATEVGTGTTVAAGTYLACMNAKATPEAAVQAGTDTGISAQFFLYDQVKNSSFTGDLLNLSTPLQPDGTNHDSYASGCTLVTVPAGGQTWHIYAFGYDTNDGSGNYAVDDVSLALTAITPAS